MIHWTDKWKSVRLKDLTLVAHFPASAPFSILHDTISFCLVLLWWLWAKCRKLYFMYGENETTKWLVPKDASAEQTKSHSCCAHSLSDLQVSKTFFTTNAKVRSLAFDWHSHLFSFAFHSSILKYSRYRWQQNWKLCPQTFLQYKNILKNHRQIPTTYSRVTYFYAYYYLRWGEVNSSESILIISLYI